MRSRSTLVLFVALAGLLPACDRAADDADVAPALYAQPTEVPNTAAPFLGPKVFPLEAARALDGPGRDEWQRPDDVVAALAIRPGDRVADVGCGTGYFTLRFAQAVGPDGRVLALDIQPGMLELLSARLDDDTRPRVELRCSEPERPLVATDRMDLVFCANTLHEVDDPAPFVQSLADGLAPGGRLAFINWLPTRTPFGPPLAHRIAPARVTELAAAAGLAHERNVALLDMHSFQVFRKPVDGAR